MVDGGGGKLVILIGRTGKPEGRSKRRRSDGVRRSLFVICWRD